ncbi:Oxysterol-binding protein 2 [Schistosoma japonicum]|nr:Oxysterol-binding protein 2 [Schistosoma japonicum]
MHSTPKKRRAKTATISCHNSSLPTHSDVIHASSTSLSSLANVEESSISFSDSELPNGFTNIALRNGAIESIQCHSDGYRNVYKRNSATGQHNGTLKYVNNTGRIRKRRSTIPVSPKIALNLWGIIKNAIGKDLSKIPIPLIKKTIS